MEHYIDAADSIIGRVATVAAKAALLGDTVKVLNCEKAVVSGSRKNVLADAHTKAERIGQPTQGPHVPRVVDRYVRRIITRMLPREKKRGRDAVKRVLCYTGIPEEFKDKKLRTVAEAHLTKLPTFNYVTIAETCANSGGRR